MRKYIATYGIGVLAVVILFLSGCSVKSIVYSDQYVSGQDSQYWYVANGDLAMAESDDGYYFMNGEDWNYLYYKGKDATKAVPICNKPECMHNDNTCDAYLGDVPILLCYMNQIYYVQYTNHKHILCKISSDGSQHRDLLTFSKYVYQIAMHRGYVYYVTTDFGTISGKENDTQTIMGLYRIPLDKVNTEPELLYEIEGINANVGKLLCYGNAVYFNESFYTDAAMTQRTQQVNRLNIQSGIIDTILEGYGGQYTITNDKLAFTSREGTFLSDLDGQHIQKVWNQYGILLSSEHYVLIDTLLNRDVLHDIVPRSIIAINPEGDPVGSVELIDESHSFMIPIGVVDDSYIIPFLDQDTQAMTLYQIPVDKIADGTGQPEVFFEYVPEE